MGQLCMRGLMRIMGALTSAVVFRLLRTCDGTTLQILALVIHDHDLYQL
jgi:hypothetical protein